MSHTRRDLLRHALRGAGLALTLPWLESLSAGEPARAPAGPPKRFVAVFMGNGVNVAHWFPKVGADGLQLSKTLAPLAGVRDQLLVFKGLHNPNALIGAEGHYPRMNLLAGGVVKRTTTNVQLGQTMDQLAAQHLCRSTPLTSLVLGTEPPMPGTELGYAQTYSGHISWSTPTTPVPKEIRPRLAFDRLFDGGEGLRRDRSLLDGLRADAQRLSNGLPHADRQRVDTYLTSIRELEHRIQQTEAAAQQAADGWRPTIAAPTMPRPELGIPANIGEHQRLMMDILVLALQADRTRVATMMLTNDLSGKNFSFLDGVKGATHELSHHNNDAEKLASYQRVNQWHIEVLAGALAKMQAVDEGGSTLLDRTAVLFCSSLMDGNAHDGSQLPILVAGGKGLGLRGNRLIEAGKDRKLCRLHMALLQRLDVPVQRFGDAESALEI